MASSHSKPYALYLLAISGLGGLLYGVDIGIIDPALRYLNRSIQLSESALSAVVAAVLAGSILGSVLAGLLADWLGRKRMMIGSGLIFVGSVAIIYASQSLLPLLAGRLLQGASGGMIAVVAPLYLAECLPSTMRGRGAAIFQFMLTVGILLAALVGSYYTERAETAIVLAGAHAPGALAAADHAWRGMFLAVAYPGILFLLGTLFLPESPRWLVRQGRVDEALGALKKMRDGASCQRELDDILAAHMHERKLAGASSVAAFREILSTRRYVLPFVLSCVILGCCQATGINSILQFMSTILQKAGLDPVTAAFYGSGIKVVNAVMTIVAVMLVERKGRVFLLTIGTSGILAALVLLSVIFYRFESRQVDMHSEIAAMVTDESLVLDLANPQWARSLSSTGELLQLTVLYNQGDKQNLAEVFILQGNGVAHTVQPRELRVARVNDKEGRALKLEIVRARAGPVPSQSTGMLGAFCIGLFIASFSIGPGVCVWLALSELMPTRIRSVGMGVALLINQGVSTLIALLFLPVVGRYGFHVMFLFWAVCTLLFLVAVRRFLPETKGKTLEEIEAAFA